MGQGEHLERDPSPFRIGIVGAAGRGAAFASSLRSLGARVQAVCDIHAEGLEQTRLALGAAHAYTDYTQMLEAGDLDAVLVATPMHLHVPMATAALERGIAVLSEVTAGVSLEECQALVAAAARSDALYMLAENYCYTKANMFVQGLVRAGLFGEPYYAEGEYLHDVTELAERTPWRRYWQLGMRGNTYCTHSLGPILQWFGDDRVVAVSCVDTGQHRRDPRGEPYAADSSTMLCRTPRGRLIKIRVDLVSPRPHAMTNYQLQGTDGAYESSRDRAGDRGRIWLRALFEPDAWLDPETLMRLPEVGGRYLPPLWWDPPTAALQAGHGGGDYMVLHDFIRACRGEIPCPIDVHRAMDMTLPGLVSQQSVLEDGRWLPVPDSREWPSQPRRSQLNMLWPEEQLGSPPQVVVPPGYTLRQYHEGDEREYLALLAAVDLAHWDAERFARVQATILPGGFFVVTHDASGALVATALAQHNPRPLHPQGGEVGWVAADPAHSGRGLGRAVTAAAVQRLLAAGYQRIYLLSDDNRLPALHTYLAVGFRPYLCEAGMAERWEAVYRALGREG
ncbi:MAG: hypothetical protein DCC58_07690 [Chloroflexi bacterium]|nr:MAG: hypothetical protein DCC58_07690 [Chloroflexota bacterium]